MLESAVASGHLTKATISKDDPIIHVNADSDVTMTMILLGKGTFGYVWEVVVLVQRMLMNS